MNHYYFIHFDLEMFMDALHLPKFNAWLYIFFFYRNRCGRIWSNMSSQPKRVFKLGYHIEYLSTIHLKKKRNIFYFIQYIMKYNLKTFHLVKIYLTNKKIFFFISASRSKSENYLPYLNMKKKPALTFHYLFSTFKLFKSLCLVYSQ